MRIYLDNCCYNRPYDDQSQMRIHQEAEAKLYIQDMVSCGQLELVTSFMLDYENEKNRNVLNRNRIGQFMRENESYYVGNESYQIIEGGAMTIMKTGIKQKDAFHIASAIYAECAYFLTTDDRLLKYENDKILIVTPCEFIRRLEAD